MWKHFLVLKTEWYHGHLVGGGQDASKILQDTGQYPPPSKELFGPNVNNTEEEKLYSKEAVTHVIRKEKENSVQLY